MSLIDTSFDDATAAPSAEPTKVAPLIPKVASTNQNQKSEDQLNEFNALAAPNPPAPAAATPSNLDDLMSFSPVVGKKVTA